MVMDDVKTLLHGATRFPEHYIMEIAEKVAILKRVRRGEAWLSRLDQLAHAPHDTAHFHRNIEDHLFELKVMSYLATSEVDDLEYEPKGQRPDGRRCDLRARIWGRSHLIELKAFHPESKEREIPEEHLPPRHIVIMDPVTAHEAMAVRRHLIDATLDTEDKLAEYSSDNTGVLAVSIDYYLDLESFRDFVWIYRHGSPRVDDPFGKMTMHNVGKPFRGTITEFWGLPFQQTSFALDSDETAVRVDERGREHDQPLEPFSIPQGPRSPGVGCTERHTGWENRGEVGHATGEKKQPG